MATVAPSTGLVPIMYDPDSTAAMPADIKAAVEAYLNIVRDYLSTHSFPLTHFEVSSFVLPGEEHRYWIVTHWLDASADSALTYWAEIDGEIERQASAFPPGMATLLIEGVGTSVRWNIA